jgi:hypothetical protein
MLSRSLPALLKSKGRAGWDAVKDVLLATLRQLDAEAQIAAAEGLRLAVQQRALAAADAADCLLPLAVSNARAKDKSADVVMRERRGAWLSQGVGAGQLAASEHTRRCWQPAGEAAR